MIVREVPGNQHIQDSYLIVMRTGQGDGYMGTARVILPSGIRATENWSGSSLGEVISNIPRDLIGYALYYVDNLVDDSPVKLFTEYQVSDLVQIALICG